MPDREQALATFYAQEARALEHAVARVVCAPHATIEDACNFAWQQLVRRLDDLEISDRTFWWLYRVAVREVWHLSRIARRCVPVGAVPQPTSLSSNGLSTHDIAEQRETLRELRDLAPGRRRPLVLFALGFTYAEIARITGSTQRAVERQLRRAREDLLDEGLAALTRRERHVLDGLAAGLTAEAIAERLHIRRVTVEGYMTGIYRKLGVSCRADAVALLHGVG